MVESLLCHVASSPLGYARTSNAHELHKTQSGTSGSNPQIYPNEQQFLGELHGQLSTKAEPSHGSTLEPSFNTKHAVCLLCNPRYAEIPTDSLGMS